MDTLNIYIIPLYLASDSDEKIIGGKAGKLAKLFTNGYPIPKGFCITIYAYQQFVRFNLLDEKIKFELGRKSFESMRWEEIWDAALRIRSAFIKSEIPSEIRDQILKALENLGVKKKWVVRSSAPKEDSAKASFAGLHESFVGVHGDVELFDAVRLVWASLWSDAALLYQHELGLNPFQSSMAVVVQELVEEKISGVAFGRDPRNPKADRAIIEAVPGLCQDLVDGVLDPTRWIIKGSTGELIEVKQGKIDYSIADKELLAINDLKNIYKALQGIESLFGWHPDIEWTGRDDRFTLLQARPITTSDVQPQDEKASYLKLRPAKSRLKKLADRVADELIPQMEAEGENLALADLRQLNDQQLADAIESRQKSMQKWQTIYWNDFIPFAHGVRNLGTFYNDAVHPSDPYEFVGLLKGQSMISTRRNQRMMELAYKIRSKSILMEYLNEMVSKSSDKSDLWDSMLEELARQSGGKEFLQDFQDLMNKYMDVSYDKKRLKDQPIQVLQIILEMAKAKTRSSLDKQEKTSITQLEEKLFDAVGVSRLAEAEEVLRIGRLSWRLRDDDNLLLGRIESQFFRVLSEGIDRLQSAGRLEREVKMDEKTTAFITHGLRHPGIKKVKIPIEKPKPSKALDKRTDIKPRQLIGQPAAPGLVSGKVRIIRISEDLGKFQTGEVLVCDAIQPNMTHLVPLASAIIERRGGMLIHGAIIAREMGIPCVNGVENATGLLENGELVNVDGHLGIVTVGAAEFDLEIA